MNKWLFGGIVSAATTAVIAAAIGAAWYSEWIYIFTPAMRDEILSAFMQLDMAYRKAMMAYWTCKSST